MWSNFGSLEYLTDNSMFGVRNERETEQLTAVSNNEVTERKHSVYVYENDTQGNSRSHCSSCHTEDLILCSYSKLSVTCNIFIKPFVKIYFSKGTGKVMTK